MVELPQFTLPTINHIYTHYSEMTSDYRRAHLGASQIGKDCERALWYSFRWCVDPKYEGRILRLFETGNQQESRIIQNLRDIGVTVYDRDPETGEQFHYASFGGHYAGSLDGVGVGFEESKQPHVIELKTSNVKNFNKLKKNGVKDAKPEHFSQMQQYMSWAGLERAYYICVCKDTDELYGERIHLNKNAVCQLEAKAKRIIFADNPPFQVSDNDNHPSCKFCLYKEVCHMGILPEVNCRTCANVTVEPNGTWTCKGRVLCLEEQKSIHDCHIFNPELVPLEVTDADSDTGTISYGQIVNGPGQILSIELQEAIDKVEGRESEI